MIFCFSTAEAKFFLGVDGGYEMSDITLQSGEKGHVLWGGSIFKNIARLDAWTAGINLGTEHEINNFLNLRWFLGLNYGQNINFKAIYQLQQIDIQLGVDTIFNFVKSKSYSFGLLLGLGTNLNTGDFFGMFFKKDLPLENFITSYGQVGIFGNVGLTLGLGEHSRIDFITRIPIMNVVLTQGGGVIYSPIRFTVGYKYLF